MRVVVVDRIHGHPGKDAIGILDGRIVWMGRAGPGPHLRLGGTMLPGLRDAHIHPFGVAAAARQVDLSAVRSFREAGDLLVRQAETGDRATPVIAIGLDDERLEEGTMPTRYDLDAAVSDRPVLVYRHCSHVASANSAALRRAGIDDESPDPAGGRLRRTPAGRVTGVLEEAAVGNVSSALAGSVAPVETGEVESVLLRLRRRGVVAIDAIVSTGDSMWCTGGDELEGIARLADRAPVRIAVHVAAGGPAELDRAVDLLTGPMVRFAGWKGFADGSLGGRTAALRAPYADDPSTSGMDRAADGHLEWMASEAGARGGSAAIHAIGDRAVDAALDIAGRHDAVRIEHASVTDPAQVARMRSANVIASVQPSFVRSDAPWLDRRLGPGRAGWAYPFRSMLEAGVEVRAGSDAPIESADPFVGIRDAVSPRPEALTLEQAIDVYADSPLEVGGPATFIVTDRDPFVLAPDDLPSIVVREVWIDGVPVE